MNTPESAMSKKTAIAGMAITAISAVDKWETQGFIVLIALAAIAVQGLLDWRKRSAGPVGAEALPDVIDQGKSATDGASGD